MKPITKKRIILSLVGLFLSIAASFSQSIDLPTDTVTALLCSKWEVNYALIGGMKIGRMPGATEIKYEFNKDGTILLTSTNPNKKAKGTWVYDSKKGNKAHDKWAKQLKYHLIKEGRICHASGQE
ncbi:hypothetical protein D3C80_1023790 [compost metagenome]